MARKALIFFALLLVGCQSSPAKRIEVAAVRDGEARAKISLPDLPTSCTAKVGRVKIGDEPWVLIVRRYDVLIANRDDKADDCAAWWASYRLSIQ